MNRRPSPYPAPAILLAVLTAALLALFVWYAIVGADPGDATLSPPEWPTMTPPPPDDPYPGPEPTAEPYPAPYPAPSIGAYLPFVEANP